MTTISEPTGQIVTEAIAKLQKSIDRANCGMTWLTVVIVLLTAVQVFFGVIQLGWLK